MLFQDVRYNVQFAVSFSSFFDNSVPFERPKATFDGKKIIFLKKTNFIWNDLISSSNANAITEMLSLAFILTINFEIFVSTYHIIMFEV